MAKVTYILRRRVHATLDCYVGPVWSLIVCTIVSGVDRLIDGVVLTVAVDDSSIIYSVTVIIIMIIIIKYATDEEQLETFSVDWKSETRVARQRVPLALRVDYRRYYIVYALLFTALHMLFLVWYKTKRNRVLKVVICFGWSTFRTADMLIIISTQ